MDGLYVILFICSLICGAYVVLIINYTFAWFGLCHFTKTSRKEFSTKVSVIIPARNEENNIINCLNDIIAQDYPINLFEMIIVDDSSTDNTSVLVEEFTKAHPSFMIKLIHLSGENITSYKKQAVQEAISRSQGELIITTDADCRMNKQWIATIIDYYETYHPKVIAAPVCFHKEDSYFKKLQSLEFLSLIAVGAASSAMNNPILCNGANLAYEKKAFYTANGFNENTMYTSGDDIFMLLKIKKQYPDSIHFIKNYEAIVFTEAKSTLNEFFHQRIRWISKTRACKDTLIIITALIVWFFNFSLLIGLILGFIYPYFTLFLALTLFIKLLVDLSIMFGITSFMRRKKLMYCYLPLQLINILYTVFMGVFGNFSTFEWKGRRLYK